MHGIYSPSFSIPLLSVKLSSFPSLWALTPRHAMCPCKLLMGKGAGTRWMVGVLRESEVKEQKCDTSRFFSFGNYKLSDWVTNLINCNVRLLHFSLEITPLTMHSHANNSRYSVLTFLPLIILGTFASFPHSDTFEIAFNYSSALSNLLLTLSVLPYYDF